jgi:hypothetical protein
VADLLHQEPVNPCKPPLCVHYTSGDFAAWAETLAMGYRRALIRLLDRPGARGVLGSVINQRARRYAPGVRVYYHRGMWMHPESGVIYVDSPTMD